MKKRYKFFNLIFSLSAIFSFAGCFDSQYTDAEIVQKINSILNQYQKNLQFESLVLYNAMNSRNIWALYSGFNDDDRIPKKATPFNYAYQPSYLYDQLVYSQPWSIYDNDPASKPRNFMFEVAKLGKEISSDVYSAQIILDQPNPIQGSALTQDNQLLFWMNFNIKYMTYDLSYQAETIFNRWFKQDDNPINKLTQSDFDDIYQTIKEKIEPQSSKPPLPDKNNIVLVNVRTKDEVLNDFVYSGFIKTVDPNYSYKIKNNMIYFNFLTISLWYKQICDYGQNIQKPMFINIKFNIENNLIVNKTLLTFSNPGASIDLFKRTWYPNF